MKQLIGVAIILLSLVSCELDFFAKQEEDDKQDVVVELGEYQLKLKEIENLTLSLIHI